MTVDLAAGLDPASLWTALASLPSGVVPPDLVAPAVVEQFGEPPTGDGGVNVDIDFTGPNLVGSAVGSFLTTLIVGGIMVALAEGYTGRMMDRVVDDPVGSFVYGLVVLVFLFLVTFVLVITVIGILVAIPLVILSYVVWAIGSAIAFLAIGDRLVGREDGWLKPLLVGAAANGLLTLTGIGGLVSFAVGAAGFGAVLQNWLE